MKWLGWIGVVLMGAVVMVLEGVVLSQLWGWFFVPLFGGPYLGVAQAIGLTFLVSFFKIGLKREEPEVEGAMSKGCVKLLAYALALLVIWGVSALWFHLVIGGAA